ncbi:MAG: hypothetical protein GY851_15630 [bacterium]|nr:hypothetical protein [bacterium]
MADDKPLNGETPEEEDGGFASEEGGLGNLPPLSDFESSAGGMDSNLPPLGSMDSDGGEGLPAPGSDGGLPPVSDIPIETPVPTGGNVKAAPPGFEGTDAFDTSGSDGGLDTPLETPAESDGTGFQDLGADSDFTPETPEVAPPGPDSDMETPMFDSAFGGASDFSGAADTSAPTQAMETPMFGADAQAPGEGFGDEAGFDADAFNAGAGAIGADDGTPAPDFSPDTGAAMPEMAAAPETPQPPAKKGKVKKSGGGGIMGKLVAAILCIIGIAIGLFVGPMVAHNYFQMPGQPNPYVEDVDGLNGQISGLNKQLQKLKEDLAKYKADTGGQTAEEMLAELNNMKEELEGLTSQKEALDKQISDTETKLADAETTLEETEQELAETTAAYEERQNQLAITQAREAGLSDEVLRLQRLVGNLENANARRLLTKETLQSNINELVIQVREGNPLTPSQYSRRARMARVEALQQRVTGANWVSPELLEAYTSLYIDELNIAASREYFFAKIPVVDRFGTKDTRWAECLMNGGWSTYYRTVDGEHVGVYQPVSGSTPARHEFVEISLSEVTKKKIENEIVAARTPGWEERLDALVERQAVTQNKSKVQEVMDSL